MRIIYFTLLMVFTFALSAQEHLDFQNQKSEEILDFKLYPNPAIGGMVNITTKDNAIKQIAVYDVFGKVVLTDKISRNMLNISQLIPGVYMLQVTENNKTITRKLVVK